MANLEILLVMLGANLISHLLILIFNTIKSSQNSPIMFKVLTYFSIFTINVISFSVFIFYIKLFTNSILLLYTLVTLSLFIIHFFFDEDWLFRFEKGLTFAFIFALTTIIYSLIFFLLF